MEDKNKQISPISSDVLQNKTAVAAAAQKAKSSPNTSSESEAKEKPASEKPAGDPMAVPQFNLAEKILAEQRRFASERRHKAGPGGAAGGNYAADDTLGAVIREVKDNMARSVGRGAGADGVNPAVCESPVDSADAAAQRLLIADIVSRDITTLCRRRRRDSLNR